MTLKERINNSDLSQREDKIVRILMENLSKVAFLSGPQLAERCHVSPSAVTRFAQKIGYSGYPELKRELESIFRKSITPYEMFSEYLDNNKTDSIRNDSVKQDIQNMLVMEESNKESDYLKCIEMIAKANRVFSGAIEASKVFVDLFDFYMGVLGRNHTALCGFGLLGQFKATTHQKGDVFIAVSYQRIFKEVRDAALYAKERGLYTIAVTDSVFNPLSKVCDSILIAPVTGASFGYTHTAPVALVNMIVNSLAVKNPGKSLDALQVLKQNWDTTDLFCSEKG